MTVFRASSGKLFSLLRCPSIADFKLYFVVSSVIVFPDVSFDRCPIGLSILCFRLNGYLLYFKMSGS